MKDKENRTPLHFAAGFNHEEIARMLIAEGAQLEVGVTHTHTHIHTRTHTHMNR